MQTHGDTEAVNLSTGERQHRISGNGGNVLDGIEGLNPVNPDDLAEYERAMREEVIPQLIEDAKKRRRGLILPPEAGCVHDWQPIGLPSDGNDPGLTWVKRCSKCYVLGCPPKEVP